MFAAFTLKLSPARRILYCVSLVLALVGLLELFRGFRLGSVPAAVFNVPMVVPTWANGTIPLLVALFLGEPGALPCGDGTLSSTNVQLLDSNGDAEVDVSDVVYGLLHLFQGGPAPALGSSCGTFTGCPDVCR